MSSEVTNLGWNSPLVNVHEYKRFGRLAVPDGFAFEKIGVDGDDDGGWRPFRGWDQLHTLSNITNPFQSDLYTESPYITDIFGVEFLINDNSFGYGFVYRVQRKALWQEYVGPETTSSTTGELTDSTTGEFRTYLDDGARADIFIDYYSSATGVMKKGVKIGNRVLPNANYKGSGEGADMDVAIRDRNIYIFVQGRSPILFYINDDNEEVLFGGPNDNVTKPGPGKKPTMLSPGENVEPGTIIGTGDNNRSAAGQVFLTDLTPRYLLKGVGDPRFVETSQTTTGDDFTAPTTTVDDGTTTLTADDTTYNVVQNPGGQKDADPVYLSPGKYAFAFQLFDSETGRKSPLSELATTEVEEWKSVNNARGTSSPISGQRLYAAIEIAWNTAEFDTAIVYRSVKVTDAGGTFTANILQEEAVITLSDYATSATTSSAAVRNAIYYYELSDTALATTEPYVDSTLHDEEMPYGGAARFFSRTLFVSNTRGGPPSQADENNVEDTFNGLGELRWSDLSESSPELFPPSNRLLPSTRGSSIIAFAELDPYLIGLSRDRPYHIDDATGFIRIRSIHQGYGIVNNRAFATAGSFVYWLSEGGFVSNDTSAQLDEVSSLNGLIRNEWKDDLEWVTMAYDPILKALCAHNPIRRQQAWIWFKTPTVTELYDCPFEQVFQGSFSSTFLKDGSLTSEPRRQIMALKNAAIDADTPAWRVFNGATVAASPVVMGVDYNRDHRVGLETTNRPTLLTLPSHAQTTCTLLVDYPAGTPTAISSQSLVVLQTDYTPSQVNSEKFVGATIYGLNIPALVTPQSRNLEGAKAIIRDVFVVSGIVYFAIAIVPGELGGRPIPATDTSLAFSQIQTPVSGLVMGVSPVYMRGVFTVMNPQTPEGQFGKFLDFFRRRRADNLGCSFTQVTTPTTNFNDDHARFRALLYEGNATQPTQRVFSRDNSGQTVTTITNGESTYHAAFGETASSAGRNGRSGSQLVPGVEIFCPDIDYRLMGVLVGGDFLAHFRNQRPS